MFVASAAQDQPRRLSLGISAAELAEKVARVRLNRWSRAMGNVICGARRREFRVVVVPPRGTPPRAGRRASEDGDESDTLDFMQRLEPHLFQTPPPRRKDRAVPLSRPWPWRRPAGAVGRASEPDATAVALDVGGTLAASPDARGAHPEVVTRHFAAALRDVGERRGHAGLHKLANLVSAAADRYGRLLGEVPELQRASIQSSVSSIDTDESKVFIGGIKGTKEAAGHLVAVEVTRRAADVLQVTLWGLSMAHQVASQEQHIDVVTARDVLGFPEHTSDETVVAEMYARLPPNVDEAPTQELLGTIWLPGGVTHLIEGDGALDSLVSFLSLSLHCDGGSDPMDALHAALHQMVGRPDSRPGTPTSLQPAQDRPICAVYSWLLLLRDRHPEEAQPVVAELQHVAALMLDRVIGEHWVAAVNGSGDLGRFAADQVAQGKAFQSDLEDSRDWLARPRPLLRSVAGTLGRFRESSV